MHIKRKTIATAFKFARGLTEQLRAKITLLFTLSTLLSSLDLHLNEKHYPAKTANIWIFVVSFSFATPNGKMDTQGVKKKIIIEYNFRVGSRGGGEALLSWTSQT